MLAEQQKGKFYQVLEAGKKKGGNDLTFPPVLLWQTRSFIKLFILYGERPRFFRFLEKRGLFWVGSVYALEAGS
jgi:hypothetical protein